MPELRDLSYMLIEYYENSMGQCSCREYMLRRISTYVAQVVRASMLGKLSRENCNEAREYYRSVKAKSKGIYKATCDKSTMTGKMLWLMRVTNFYAYWLLALVPGGMPNWA